MTWVKGRVVKDPAGRQVFNVEARINTDQVGYLMRAEDWDPHNSPWYAVFPNGVECVIDKAEEGKIGELA